MCQYLFTDAIALSCKRPKGYAIVRPSADEIQIYGQSGILPPVMVKPTKENTYTLIQGEKYWMLAQTLQMEQIPAFVVSDLRESDEKALIMFDLRSHGAKPDPITEAISLKQLLDDGVYKSQAELARYLGLHRSAVHHKLQLLKLDPKVKKSLSLNQLTPLHVRTLPGLPAEAQWALAQCMLSERLSAHQSNRVVAIYRANWKQANVNDFSPDVLAEQALQALKKTSAPKGDGKVNSVTVDGDMDEGTYNALLNLLGSERKLAPHKDIDVAALEQNISDKVGYICRIQLLPSGAGEYAFRYDGEMGDYLQDDLEILLGNHYRVNRVGKNKESNGWACVLFSNGTEANDIADRLLR